VDVDYAGKFTEHGPISVIPSDQIILPGKFVLAQNYPNPFNPITIIEFTLLLSGNAELKVFDMQGREVSVVVSGMLDQGNHIYTFDGSNLASGVYYYQLIAGDYTEAKKMIVLK